MWRAEQRQIDALRFEIEALKDHAMRSIDPTLMESACFMCETLQNLEQFLVDNERKEVI